jgi:hypothetical protein
MSLVVFLMQAQAIQECAYLDFQQQHEIKHWLPVTMSATAGGDSL